MLPELDLVVVDGESPRIVHVLNTTSGLTCCGKPLVASTANDLRNTPICEPCLSSGDMDEMTAGTYRYDWDFHRATGMVAAQINATNMEAAAARIVTLAAIAGSSVHDTALMVLDGRLRHS